MKSNPCSLTTSSFLRGATLALLAAICCFPAAAVAQELEPHVKPNYRQAAQYSSRYLRQFLYDTRVRPNWIGKTDQFWYSFKTSDGTNYYRVDPATAKKDQLFDRVKLGAQLGEIIKKPVDPKKLPISRLSTNDEGTEIKFVSERIQFTYDLAKEKLSKGKEAKQDTSQFQVPSRFRGTREEYVRMLRERGISIPGSSSSSRSHRVFSPDRKKYVFAKGHNLYMMELPPDYGKDDKDEKDGKGKDGKGKDDKGKDDKGKDGKGKDDKGQDDKGKSNKDKDGDDKDGDDKDGDDKDKKDKDGEDKDDDKGKDDKSDDSKSDDDDKENSEQSSEADDKQDVKEQDKKDSDDDKKGDDQEKKDGNKTDDKDGDKKDDKDGDKKDDKDGDKKDDKDGDKKDDKDGDDKDGDKKDDDKDAKSKEIPIPKVKAATDREAVKLTKDGVDRYSFAGRTSSRGRGGSRTRTEIKDDQKTRPNVRWSKDSKSFYVTRRDSRDVKELWVINSLSNPRPTLEKYDYPMPGDEKVRKSVLYYFNTKEKKLKIVEPKWKDEGYTGIHFGKTGDELRFIRRDRLLRNVELCSLKTETGEIKCLFGEGFENANYNSQSLRYLEDTDEMIWWSERSGWAHYYLYTRDGKLKNAITSGEFRASRIVSIDEKNRLLYFTGNAREPGENLYFNHLYRVRLDGTGLKLMDPGDANHTATLSPSKEFIVDNCSRVDMPPISVLRNADGKEVLKLESSDMSRLEQVGWRPPETFMVKAADGVTDLYGNMWKPFDFNPKKKYPIIAHVYPGPQMEGTRHTFTATDGNQQLAQLGFIVIQVGHRGGAPYRSKAYGSYGYFNLRDYGLADKKAAIEQLAQQFNFIDVERVGIYGHSGGGFMTAAALLQKPYNEFFKVGVSTAGNHDNNIYNNSWSERYHGLKVASTKSKTDSKSKTGESGSSTRRSTRGGRRGGTSPPAELNGRFDFSQSDHFYEFELFDDPELNELALALGPEFWDRASSSDHDPFRESPDLNFNLQDQDKKSEQDKKDSDETKQDSETKKDQDKKSDDKKSDDKKSDDKKSDDKKSDDKKSDDKKSDDKKSDDKKSDDKKDKVKADGKKSDDKKAKSDGKKSDGKKSDGKKGDKKAGKKEGKFDKVKFEIKVPTNAELAENLRGHLFLIHGEADNNVHPANTLRLVDALIKANKRFDMLYLPATRHGFGSYQPYVTQRMYEYFAEHLLNDYQNGPNIGDKK